MAFFLSPRFPHTPRKQAPRTVLEQQISDSQRYNPNWHHAYAQRPRIPTSDTGNYAYASLGLAEFTPIGTGIWNRTPIKAVMSNGLPLVYFKSIPGPTGLGGLVSGQLFGQPLIDPNNQGY